ncbi:polymerase [Morganella morganii]|uniref:Polymerase n=5 Tax=Morganella morganii TaxID=582 RepID=A0AAU8ZKX7_MORMO|nr:polymerase [Morganella morganii]
MVYSRGLVFFFLFWLTGSLVFIQNSGGYGLSLPQNCFSWAMMGILIFSVSLSVIRKKQYLVITPALRLFAAGVVILALPLLYTRPEWRLTGGLYWAGAAAGLLFYLCCVQLKLNKDQIRFLVLLWLSACMAHALLVLLQLTPAGGWIPWPVLSNRPYGVFQQVNLLATFLSCGMALALFLFLLPEQRQSGISRGISVSALLIMPCVLVLIQSRIGLLSAVITAVMLLLSVGTYRRKYSAVILLAGGVIAGWWLKNHTQIGVISHLNSDHARLEMFSSTWEMLKQRPLIGWGAGGFEYVFQMFRVLQGKSTEGTGVVIHPHNEILFWGAEGGVVALTGLALIITGGGLIIQRAWLAFYRGNNPLPLTLCLTILPLLLHTQTEYPFGLSALHFALCLLLLSQADRATASPAKTLALPSFFSMIAAGTGAGMICIMAGAFLTGIILTETEQQGMQDIRALSSVPEFVLITQYERVEFDRHVHKLMQFNQTGEPRLLADYRRWAVNYLKKHTDKNVYISLIMILHYQGDSEAEKYYLNQAGQLFPQDIRFFSGRLL